MGCFLSKEEPCALPSTTAADQAVNRGPRPNTRTVPPGAVTEFGSIDNKVINALLQDDVTLVDCATAANSDRTSRELAHECISVLISDLRAVPDLKYEVLLPERPYLDASDNDEPDYGVLKSILAHDTWSGIKTVDLSGSNSERGEMYTKLRNTRSRCGDMLMQGLKDQDDARVEMYDEARHCMLQYFYSGFKQMTLSEYKEASAAVYSSGRSTTLDVNAVVRIVQDRALRTCKQRTDTERSLPRSKVFIFVLPEVPGEISRVNITIKNAQDALAMWSSQGFSCNYMFACITQSPRATEDMAKLDRSRSSKTDNVDTVILDPLLLGQGFPPKLRSKILAAGKDRVYDELSSQSKDYYSKTAVQQARNQQELVKVDFRPNPYDGEPPEYADRYPGNGKH